MKTPFDNPRTLLQRMTWPALAGAWADGHAYGSAAHVICPSCLIDVRVPIDVYTAQEGDRQTLVADPDMADLWAHMWTHEGVS